jgi:hypothetical protein
MRAAEQGMRLSSRRKEDQMRVLTAGAGEARAAALSGKGAHVATRTVLASPGKPRGRSRARLSLPTSPEARATGRTGSSSGWEARVRRSSALPEAGLAGGPSGRRDWDEAVRQFRRGLVELERGCRGADLSSGRGRKSRLEMLHAIGAHNSYHAGQVVFLRQLLGKWPPPSGGLTW